FCHSQGWSILAEALIGRGDRAFEYWREISPAYMNEKAEIRKMEPYVHGQFIEGVDSPNPGRAHVHWLTGTASTVMVAIVEGILGLKPTPDGITINPSIPSEWDSFKMVKNLRGKKLNITVLNPNGNQSGVKSVSVNGKTLDGTFIPDSILGNDNEVTITM
ncbi:MAG: N,N'-diacetylchitobiose phosphorylase, partial [Oscillospiraceae bacterium]|nr:N,N'-diacetylchitobiose phosphorylase [Oscillospiraceae bacterium]